MRVCTECETVNIVLQSQDRDPTLLGPGRQQLNIVKPLRTGGNLLAAHEDVVGAGPLRVVLAEHGIEGPGLDWVPVQDEEVRLVLVEDELAEPLFGRGAEVSIGLLLEAVFVEHCDALLIGEPEGLLGKEKGLVGVLGLNGAQELGEALVEALEDVEEEIADDLKHFEVMLLNRHLDIKPHKLRHVLVRVRVLSPEHGCDLEHPVQIPHDRHLLVQLRGLREARLFPEVIQPEDFGAAL